MLKLAMHAAKGIFSRREKEFDIAQPGPSRPMTGLFHHLPESQKQRVLSYKGAEYTGGARKGASGQ